MPTNETLLDSVKRLAEAQKCGALFEKLTRIETGVYVPTWFYFDFPALLAHMQAQQAVVDAARELRDGMDVGASDGNSHRHLSVQQWRWDAFKDALTALENLRSDNDGK